jgi:RimJ/RimL family protein N-acetyltransferase
LDRQPVLEGERLLLRPLVQSDWDALYDVASDPLIWEQHPVPERAEEPYFRDYFDRLLDRAGTLIVERLDTGWIIGSSTYSNYRSTGSGAVEIGSTFLARSEWGGQTNRELKRLMLDHAFRFVGLVEFLIGEKNWRSRRAIGKIGARLTDRIIVAENAGRRIPHLVHEMTRKDFAMGPLSV